MLDRNGIEIRTGDFVRISNAYYKTDNGVYFVEYSPGDPTWSGMDHALQKVKRNGEISTAKYRHAFWPLESFCSDHIKNALADDWNREHAEIEIISGIDRTAIIAHFTEEANNHDEQAKEYGWRWGENSEWAVKYRTYATHYRNVVKRISA